MPSFRSNGHCRIRQQQEIDIGKRAETRFALARALWDSNRDRARARALAEQAKTDYASQGAKSKVAEIDRWLDSHGSFVAGVIHGRNAH